MLSPERPNLMLSLISDRAPKERQYISNLLLSLMSDRTPTERQCISNLLLSLMSDRAPTERQCISNLPCLRRALFVSISSTCNIRFTVFDLPDWRQRLRLAIFASQSPNRNIGAYTQLCPWPYSTTTPKPDFTYTPLWISSASVINRVSI